MTIDLYWNILIYITCVESYWIRKTRSNNQICRNTVVPQFSQILPIVTRTENFFNPAVDGSGGDVYPAWFVHPRNFLVVRKPCKIYMVGRPTEFNWMLNLLLLLDGDLLENP